MLLPDSISSDINIILLPLRKHFVTLRLSKTIFLAIELTRSLFNVGKLISNTPHGVFTHREK